jgi:metal-responsive CopG/Arc/MetJ family transcriptional regulator
MKKGIIMSTVTIVSESQETSSHLGLIDLRNGYDDIIFGNMHLHIEGGFCIEIFLVKGDLDIVMEFVYKSKALRGVMEVQYTITPTENK